MQKIYLVDVSSLFFRAFYAIRQLNNSKGMPTNALYGFLAAITKILREHNPDGIAFCFDRPEDGFREELYPEYKANRDEAPEDLVKQFPYLPKIAEALSVAAYDSPGFEADDIIGTLVKKNKGSGREVIIVSGDKDFAQLVEPGVKIFDPAKDSYMDEAGVHGKFGVTPSQIIDYLAIVGDSSDNVPGVSGLGPKGAQKLLGEFKSLDGIYENLELIKNDRTRELLKTQKDQAYLSQNLVTIRCDVKLKGEPADLKTKPVDRSLLVPLLEELEFKTLLQRLLGSGGESPKTETNVTPKVELKVEKEVSPRLENQVTSEISTLEKALKNLKSSESLWLDATTKGTAVKIGPTIYRFEGDSEKLTVWLNDSLKKKSLSLSGYDTKGVAHLLKLAPESFQSVKDDVLLEAYCLGKPGSYELGDLTKLYLGQDLPEFALPEERLQGALNISQKIKAELTKTKAYSILTDIEQPLAPVLYQMERKGIAIDSESLISFSAELLKDAQVLEKEICKMAGYDFNVGSPKQLAQVLFEKLKLPTIRKTKTGFSTDSDVLEKLSQQHPICAKILDWRELTKLRSTYVEALPRLMDPQDGRIHTVFYQAVAATGRLSSAHPNLQNIPIRTPRGQRIRESFIAPKGHILVSADYSQVELRILAHITGDPGLKRAFEADLDIHTATASEVFSTKLEDVTAEQRNAAKSINFGIAYGMSDFGLAENLRISREAAAEYIAKYFTRFPGVQRYMHEVVETGKRDLVVETMFGRRRFYPELGSSNGRVRQMAERQVINMPIQGAAADVIKLAMIQIAHKLKDDNDAHMLLQVHDELVFEVKTSKAKEYEAKIKNWMENAVKLSVPLKVSVGSGTHWGDAH